MSSALAVPKTRALLALSVQLPVRLGPAERSDLGGLRRQATGGASDVARRRADLLRVRWLRVLC